jgi:imidazolonepropionase-like amidohydrolase
MQDINGLRSALESLGNTAPTLVIAGTSLAHSEGSAANQYSDNIIGAASADEARQWTGDLIDLGADQINLVLSITQEAQLLSISSLEAQAEMRNELPPVLSSAQLEAIVDVAHDHGKWVAAQAVFPDEAAIVLAAGVDELSTWPSQSEPIPDELIQSLVAGDVPVVSGFNISHPQDGDVRRFLDAGGTLVFGTFAPNSGPLNQPIRELRLMAMNGMTPMEIILAATANAAKAVGLGDVVGTLEPGKQADIIVVDGDLFDDSNNMQGLSNVAYVVKGGELVVQPEANGG